MLLVQPEFDPASYTIRVRGKNKTDTPHVRMNSFHTLELDVNRKLTLTKELWDEVTL
jgi:protein pelota